MLDPSFDLAVQLIAHFGGQDSLNIPVRHFGTPLARRENAGSMDQRMSGNAFHFCRALKVLSILLLVLMQACALARSKSPHASSQTQTDYDLSGVWTGTSITGCTPLRSNGPWRCGARADIMLTFVREDSAAMLGIFASDRGRAGDAFAEAGRIVDMPASVSQSLYFRVAIGNHASCVFNANLWGDEMGGSYICFREGMSFERGRWAVQRSY